MDLHKQLSRHLKRLNKSIRRLVATDPEFEELRTLLRSGDVELAIYVVPLINGKPADEELSADLTDDDRAFLRKAGIKF